MKSRISLALALCLAALACDSEEAPASGDAGAAGVGGAGQAGMSSAGTMATSGAGAAGASTAGTSTAGGAGNGGQSTAGAGGSAGSGSAGKAGDGGKAGGGGSAGSAPLSPACKTYCECHEANCATQAIPGDEPCGEFCAAMTSDQLACRQNMCNLVPAQPDNDHCKHSVGIDQCQ